jgi:hypothetical protein
VQTFEQTLPGLLDPLNKSSSAAGTLQAALDQLNTTYGNAITQAASYGRATDDLAQAQAAAIQAHREAADKSVQQTLQGFAERALNATSGGSLAASLLAFDDQAQQQRDAFSSQLTSLYGAAYASTTSYVAQTLTLEQTLSAERLKITQQYYDQGRQQVLSVVQSLTGYTRSLALSSASPLSAQDQYAYAQNEFGTTSAGALGGSFTDLQQLQQAAQDLLTASRAINGSGAQYAADYAQVTSVLGGIAGAPSDQLTASAMSSIQQSVTDQLTAALGALGATITGATLTNGVQTAASIYSGINGLTMSLAAANTDSIDQLIANFSQVASTISTSTTAALDEAALSRVMDYQTTRVVTALQDVEDAINALRAEIMHQAAAPSMPISYGSGSGGGGDGGSGG